MRRKPNPNPKQMYVLAFDPSLTGWGWAVLDNIGTVIDSGAIKTESEAKAKKIRKGDDRVRRVSEIAGVLLSLIDKWDPKHMVSELPHGSRQAAAAVGLGINVGVITTISIFRKIGIDWYSEADAKKAVSEKKITSKGQMVELIDKLYPSFHPIGIKYIDEAVADAIAVYHVSTMQSSTVQFLRNLKL